MSRVNTVREIRHKQQKEKTWDDRFYLEKIPPYDAYNDPNCNLLYFITYRPVYEFDEVKAKI